MFPTPIEKCSPALRIGYKISLPLAFDEHEDGAEGSKLQVAFYKARGWSIEGSYHDELTGVDRVKLFKRLV